MPQRIAGKRRFQMFPVYQILTYRMPPVHLAPHRAVRVILIEQMIFAILVYQPVGIIHPSVKRSMMIDRTVFVRIGGIKRIREFELFPAQGIFR